MEINEIKYSKRMFAFLDILGFERLVNESRRNPELVGKIANILKRSKQIALSTLKAKLTILKVDPSQYLYRAFSDTSVISGPYVSHDDLSFISMWIMYYQYFMWKEEKYFVRGAVVYGDIYYDEDVIFGPALVDAYHIESDEGKAVWPRVLISESLLNKVTQTELERDFFEILRSDDNLVYLDYLRELFHLIILGENKKLTGERQQDFGMPITLFEDHKQGILTQVYKLSKEESKAEGKKVIRKYLELSRYHNDTIDTFCKVITEILKNDKIISELFIDQLKSAFLRDKGTEYTPKFSADEHPEQGDMLNILGTVINRLIANKQDNDSTLEDALSYIVTETPNQLSRLKQTLTNSRVDTDRLTEMLEF